MKLRIADIPPEGLAVDFPLALPSLNDRVHASDSAGGDASYSFLPTPQAHFELMLEGSAVVIKGSVEGQFTTVCSRCAEQTTKSLSVPLDLVLKPEVTRSNADENAEDLHFGFYSGAELDCIPIAEEFLILALPFTVLCKDDCRGLCLRCGANLNAGPCACPPEKKGDDRLASLGALKQLLQ